MTKMKTRKAVKARFKVTGTGKVLFNRQNRRHILTKKSPKRKRQLRTKGIIVTKQADMFKRLMGEC